MTTLAASPKDLERAIRRYRRVRRSWQVVRCAGWLAASVGLLALAWRVVR